MQLYRETPKERYIFPRKRQWIFDKLRLIEYQNRISIIEYQK